MKALIRCRMELMMVLVRVWQTARPRRWVIHWLTALALAMAMASVMGLRWQTPQMQRPASCQLVSVMQCWSVSLILLLMELMMGWRMELSKGFVMV